MSRHRVGLALLPALSLALVAGAVVGSAWAYLRWGEPVAQSLISTWRPRSAAEMPEIGPVPPDDYGLNVSWMTVDKAQATYHFDLPTSFPDAYEEIEDARITVDTWNDGWSVEVYYENPDLDDDTGIILTVTDEKYFAPSEEDASGGASPYDPLDDLAPSELGWAAPDGGYRFLISSDPAVTAVELHSMMCSMRSYGGQDCVGEAGDQVG